MTASAQWSTHATLPSRAIPHKGGRRGYTFRRNRVREPSSQLWQDRGALGRGAGGGGHISPQCTVGSHGRCLDRASLRGSTHTPGSPHAGSPPPSASQAVGLGSPLLVREQSSTPSAAPCCLLIPELSPHPGCRGRWSAQCLLGPQAQSGPPSVALPLDAEASRACVPPD